MVPNLPKSVLLRHHAYVHISFIFSGGLASEESCLCAPIIISGNSLSAAFDTSPSVNSVLMTLSDSLAVGFAILYLQERQYNRIRVQFVCRLHHEIGTESQ